MYYSIGEIANKMGIAASTLRYYDREGLFPMLDAAAEAFACSLIQKSKR
ncbi:MerR family regulatory protein [Pelotomaculum schinkii]|uniref:MerR family regulatory protein n=1 Tax=Pelotomaculum schinkii TaxID=78350 RepID=A0A4Y7R6H7_9FIRM|nr:MerR family regulatory protein [Pelotomaculum schinkii]